MLSAMPNAGPVAAVTWRGSIIENSHLAHIAVVDDDGSLLYQFGTPDRLTLVRSAAKPAQALAIAESGALERFGFEDADLAMICASHSGEARHIDRVRQMLLKAGVEAGDLRCGGHPSLSEAVQRAWLRQGFAPGPLCSNCSGKHAGMLAAAKAIGSPIEEYHLPAHPLQVHVRRTVAEVCDLAEASVAWAIDGCNLPTPAFPLDRLARFYARLAAVPSASKAAEPRSQALARIYQAMTSYPELVAGEGRFCTLLMESFGGALVGKVGADGSYAIGVRESARTAQLGAAGSLGIAVKVEDGNSIALHAIVCEVLHQLGIGNAEQRALLARLRTPQMRNTMGVPTGRLAAAFVLQPGDLAPRI
jgi:L-asparaginase II